MNKFRGKALATILAAALVASSLPVTFASAKTRNAKGVLTKDPNNDEFWLVNGGSSKTDRQVEDFQNFVYDGGNAPLETADHQDVDDPEVYSISHVSGDKLCSWDIGKDDDDDEQSKGDVKLSLRKSDSEGDEVIAILYKGTYTDDDDNDIDVTASTKVTIHAVDENSTVIGDASKVKDDYYDYGSDPAGTDSPEIDGDDDEDDNFALKTTSSGAGETKQLAAFKAERSNTSADKGGLAETSNGCLAQWKMLPTITEKGAIDASKKALTAAGKTNPSGSVKDFTEHSGLKDENGAYDANYGDTAYVLECSTSSKNLSMNDGTAEDTPTTLTQDKGLAAGSEATITTTSGSGCDTSDVTITNSGSDAIYYAVGTSYAAPQDADKIEASASKADVSASDKNYVYIFDKDKTLTAVYQYAKGADATTAATLTPITAFAKLGATTPGSPVTFDASAKGLYYTKGDEATTSATEIESSTSVTAADLTSGKLHIYDGNTATAHELEADTYDAGEAKAGQATGIVTVSVLKTAGTASLTLKGKLTNGYKTVVNDDDDIKAKAKIEKKVLVDDDSDSYSISKDDTYKDTVISGTGSSFKGDEGKDGTDHTMLDIDGGYTVKFVNKTDATVNVKDDASIDGVTGKVKELDVNDAKKVGTINLKAGSVKIGDSDVKVDDITTKGNDTTITDPVISIDADNDVGAITVKHDDNGNSTVKMSAGSAKSITSKGTVSLEGSEDDTPISVATLTAKDITVDSNDGEVSVGKIVIDAPENDENGAEISLQGDQSTIKAIDFAGFGVDMKAEDFQGEVPAPTNATADDAIFETTDEDDDVTVTGDLDVNEVTVEDDSEVTFDGKLSVDDLDGSGTMYIGANKLYVGDDASGVLVKITDNAIKAGDTIFTAASDAVDDDDLDFYGFTVKCNEGKTTDTFVVDQLKFAGLAMNKTSDKIVLNDSATYTASAYAPGTSMPDGYSIEFDMEDNSGVFELTDNGNGTAAVKCVDFDDTFAEEDKATLKAYVVDEDGDEDDDYGEAECKLTALKTPEKNFVSDTNNDFSIAPGASYQFKITADSAPVMTAGTAGVVKVANVGMSGKDYFIKITATGAKGAKTGIYVNGAKLLVVTVGTSQTFKSDTTVNVTVKKGASYQYGITTSDGKAPFFTVGTGSVFNVKANGHNGSTYFFKITAAGKAGAQAGIYVNGTKVNVAKIG